MKVDFVDSHQEEHGVQPVLRALEGTPAAIAPSTYYAAKTRPVSARSRRDEQLTALIKQIHAENYGVYGARKIWHELLRRGVRVARCTVERLMRQAGLRGLLRDKSPRTTRPAAETERPRDLVKRDFAAAGPNQLWVADLTYVRTAVGWVYAAFVLDVYSRMIVGWQVATSLYTDLALDALKMAIWRRQNQGADLQGRFITRTEVSNTGRFATASDSPRPAPSRRSARGETRSTTRWPRRSTPYTRPNSSATEARGAGSTTWRWPPSSTSTGTTTDACTANSDTSHPPNTRHYTR
jgi:transposase InsO family protein